MNDRDSGGLLEQLSREMAASVERGGRATVRVNGRPRLPATGVVWSTDGTRTTIVTASHVVERDNNLTVTTPEGDELPASLSGRDQVSDIAVLRVEGGSLPVAERDGEVLVGSIVLALGRAGELSATTGVVSAVGGPWQAGQGRRIERLIATDAPMFPGFSGGPLIDAAGRVIGLLSSHLGRGQSLAVPSADVERIVTSLTQHGRVPRGFLGVAAQPVELPATSGRASRRGLLLIGVDDEGPAAEAGLTVGDIVLEVNGTSVGSMDDLRPILGPGSAGQSIRAAILRGGAPRDLTIVIGERAA